MRHTTWRYTVGIFLVLVGAGMIAMRLLGIEEKFTSLIFGAAMLMGGFLFLLPVLRSKVNWWALIPGLPLLFMGGALTASTFVPQAGEWVAPGFFLGIGLAFIITFLMYRQYWWALIPGFVVSGIGAAILLESLVPNASGDWIAFTILAFIGLAFLLVFLVNREHWWALLPAGVLASVGLLVVTGEVAYLFLGMAATFALVALFTGRDNWWAWIPGGVLALIGFAFLFFSHTAGVVGMYFFPALLILLGVAAIIQALIPRKKI